MKNFSKNNSNQRKINKNNKSSFKNNKLKSKSSSEENNITLNKNSFTRKPTGKKGNDFSKFGSRDIGSENNTYSRRNNSNKIHSELINNNDYSHQKTINKRNLDDWVWGKHSVFESLKSDRAINRIWCTSEIFSSEKFYSLLKNFKSNGVLVEEVSWNRLSQLTFGATHQGIAIQFACSKSIGLEDLIDFSRINNTNPILLALDGIKDPHNLGAIVRSAKLLIAKE